MKKSMTVLLLAALAGLTGAACAQETTLRVNVFPGSSNLALLMGIDKGFFAEHGLKIEVQNTPNSNDQRAGLARGAFEIAHAAVDNAVAMVEDAKQDAVIVMGGDGGMNELMVRPEINTIADVRGKVLAVDAPNTAYALVAKKILKQNGLIEGRDYTVRAVGGTLMRSKALATDPTLAASMVNPPFSFTVRDKGVKSLGRALDLIGPYQASGAFVMRAWAKEHAGVLERYLAAYIQSVRYAINPAHRAEAIKVLEHRFKLAPKLAEQTCEALMTPGFGLAPDARFDMEGFRRVLSLRAEIEGQWGGVAPAPDKYIDLGYYESALKTLQ